MIINIDKPIGWTSFDVVKKVKNITKHKKVGHGGTLDPFASGVLVLGTEKDTKKLSSITNSDKSYIAELQLGKLTNTLDTEGDIIEEGIVPDLNEKKIVYGNKEIKFDVDKFKKKCLLEGLDDIALSLKKSEKIENFEKDLKNQKPWIFND